MTNINFLKQETSIEVIFLPVNPPFRTPRISSNLLNKLGSILKTSISYSYEITCLSLYPEINIGVCGAITNGCDLVISCFGAAFCIRKYARTVLRSAVHHLHKIEINKTAGNGFISLPVLVKSTGGIECNGKQSIVSQHGHCDRNILYQSVWLGE